MPPSQGWDENQTKWCILNTSLHKCYNNCTEQRVDTTSLPGSRYKEKSRYPKCPSLWVKAHRSEFVPFPLMYRTQHYMLCMWETEGELTGLLLTIQQTINQCPSCAKWFLPHLRRQLAVLSAELAAKISLSGMPLSMDPVAGDEVLILVLTPWNLGPVFPLVKWGQ